MSEKVIIGLIDTHGKRVGHTAGLVDSWKSAVARYGSEKAWMLNYLL